MSGLVLLAGCSATSGSTTTTPSPALAAPPSTNTTTTSAAATGDAALSGDTAAICAQALKTGGDFAKTFADDIELQINAAAANDPAAIRQAEQKTARDVRNYAFALRDLSQLVDDAEVKKALAEMGRQVDTLAGDVGELDVAKLTGLRTALDKACATT